MSEWRYYIVINLDVFYMFLKLMFDYMTDENFK